MLFSPVVMRSPHIGMTLARCRGSESVGVSLIRGHGRLSGDRQVAVEDADGNIATYKARLAVIIATGTGAAVPPVPGLRDIPIWDNRDITTAKEVPASLLIIGGGVVGVEMAQAWKWLGVEEVTIVEIAPCIIPQEEPFAGE
jgi:dihydrolipoamide dehydrogenase